MTLTDSSTIGRKAAHFVNLVSTMTLLITQTYPTDGEVYASGVMLFTSVPGVVPPNAKNVQKTRRTLGETTKLCCGLTTACVNLALGPRIMITLPLRANGVQILEVWSRVWTVGVNSWTAGGGTAVILLPSVASIRGASGVHAVRSSFVSNPSDDNTKSLAATGYIGFICNECGEGYFRRSNDCYRCENYAQVLLLLLHDFFIHGL
jgi:hypothetical protein